MKIRKDGGLVVPFDIDKIKQAVFKALSGTGLPSESLSAKVAEDVVRMLGTDKEIVDIKEVQDCVEKALMRRDLGDASKAYILYRDMRNAARERLHVMYPGKSKPSVTDRSLLLFQSDSKGETSKWDRTRIIERLMTTFDMPNYKAAAIAKEVEDRVIASGITTVTSSLIRELVNNILEANGCVGRLQDMTMYQVPREFIASLLRSKSNENSNIVANNPEAVNLTLAEYMLKQYALDAVFSEEVKAAHISGMIYVHDLGYPHRVYAFSGKETAIVVKIFDAVRIMTMQELWDVVNVKAEPLNEIQMRKNTLGLDIKVQDRGRWVEVEQLVLSKELKQGIRIHLHNGGVHAVTAEHGVVVSRAGKFMLVRADEVRTTDKLVKVTR